MLKVKSLHVVRSIVMPIMQKKIRLGTPIVLGSRPGSESVKCCKNKNRRNGSAGREQIVIMRRKSDGNINTNSLRRSFVFIQLTNSISLSSFSILFLLNFIDASLYEFGIADLDRGHQLEGVVFQSLRLMTNETSPLYGYYNVETDTQVNIKCQATCFA